jgi:predicted phosphoribosyltransferase
MARTPFADRRAAGALLGAELARRGLGEHPVVLGLARGGVEVAAEVAAALGGELDVLVVRKIGHPAQPELGLGALAEDAEPLFDDAGLRYAGLSRDELGEVVERERAEARRRVAAYRAGRPPVDVTGRVVVVVDDGIATGVTARAGLRSVRRRGPARLVLAAPVASDQAVRLLAAEADDVVVLAAPGHFGAVSRWFEHFDQTSDREVVRLLAR